MEMKMTRVKETDPNSQDIPDYKSPANRLVHSLRQGYNNLRGKVQELREKIKYYQIKTRDLENSRAEWKKVAKDKEAENQRLQRELEALKKENIVESVVLEKKRSKF